MISLARLGEQKDHIQPHCAWVSLKIEGEFRPEEQAHVLRCLPCLRLVLLCLESETFGAVLKQLDDPAA